jgi:hypothetical protein
MATVPFGTQWGILPGSAHSNPLGSGAGYEGVGSMIAPNQGHNPQYQDYLAEQQQQTQWGQQNQDWANRNKLYNSMLGGIGNFNSNMNYRSGSNYIHPPSYASTGPIWNQQQINAQAGNQRSQMMAQAANQTRGYANSAAQRGFSPMSPMTQFMQAISGQRANIGAAQNESNLNWSAAEGNRAAQQRGEGINAGLYGSYTSALARSRDQDMQAQAQGYSQQMDQYRLLSSLLGRG